MEEIFRLEAPPDLAAAEACRNELTRSDSDSYSITVDNSNDFIHRNTNARPCTAWTDEKHNSYLNALEASFVKQLHRSLGLSSWHSEQHTCDPSPPQKLPINASSSSGQFTVLRDVSCQKIKFESNQPLPSSAAGPHVVIESPWIHHFRCSGEYGTITSADSQECNMFHRDGVPLRGKKIFSHGLRSLGWQCVCHECHQDAGGTIAEVSDQNFVDEDQEEKSRSLSRAIKLKMAAADASTKEQLVPSAKPNNTFIRKRKAIAS